MSSPLGLTAPDSILGYCTNVHAARSLTGLKEQLQRHAVAVRERVCPERPMGVGLWLPASVAAELIESDGIAAFRDWLNERGLVAYTLNGFPYGDFHRDVVKHAVYEPDWTDRRRFDYTLMLATILSELLPDDAEEGSISTLPLGWPGRFGHGDADDADRAAAQLTDLVHHLARIELNTGRCIHIDLEPEPGCVFDTAGGLVRFFKDHLLGTSDDESIRGYLRVCHDVCHSAVMFEPQAEALDTYRRAGIAVGKVQLSSAVRVDLDQQPAAIESLTAFDEPRYLHQTCVEVDGRRKLYEDLSVALRDAPHVGQWRVHYHVPLHLERVGAIDTTQREVLACLAAIRPQDQVRHFEVETYAWDVLPPDLRQLQLADGIAKELQWVRDVASKPGSN